MAEPLAAERSLLHAVLLTAVKDLRSGNRRGNIRYQSALAWFRDNTSHHCCSFVPLCEAIGLDPDRVRKRLGL